MRYPPEFPKVLPDLLPPPGPQPMVTDGRGTLDRAAFLDLVDRVTAGLLAAGAGAGTRVAFWLPNGAAYLAGIFAAAKIGALAVHVNTRFRATEAGDLLRRSRASHLVTAWGFAAADFPAILAGLPAEDRAALRCVLAQDARCDTVAGLPVRGLEHGLEGVGTAPGAAATPESPCLTFTTSGTTSLPKLVLHHQETIAGHAADVCRRFGLDAPGAVLLAAVPFCGTFGNAAAMAAVRGGAHLVCMDRFDGAAAAGLIRRHAVTHTVGGDDMYERIAAAAGGEAFETVRFAVFGAFGSGAATAIDAAEAVGMRPRGVYGSSEVQALFSTAHGPNRRLGGGVPVGDGTALSVRDPETGVPLAAGESGELWIRARSNFAGYLENPDATARAFDEAGFFRTGDLARLEGEGFVYEARLGDAMRLGGFLVAPEEIEAFLQGRPGVAAVQVVAAGTPAVPVAFVVADGAVDEAGLRAACREKLARYKVPARVVAVEAFPVVQSANGPKVQRTRLRAMAEALLQKEHVA